MVLGQYVPVQVKHLSFRLMQWLRSVVVAELIFSAVLKRITGTAGAIAYPISFL
jgi:hypothetical protein